MPVTIGETLEGFVDHSTLAQVIETIAGVCADKSEHIATNWQDQALASAWDKAGSDLLKVAAKWRTTGVPGIGSAQS